MTPDPALLDSIRAALDAATGLEADEALPHLRDAADRLTELIDESMAEAVLQGKASLRSAGTPIALFQSGDDNRCLDALEAPGRPDPAGPHPIG